MTIDRDDQVKNSLHLAEKNVKLSPYMDVERFCSDDLECLWIGYLIDGCPAIKCAVAQENLSFKYKRAVPI